MVKSSGNAIEMAGAHEDAIADFHAAQWEDVTPLFQEATRSLALGQIVHVPAFNYFESMSALELMDPKMDSGMLAPGQVILTVAERLEKGLIPLEFDAAADLVATIDRLEQCESAWRNGQPMAQSLLTCLYLHPCVTDALLLSPTPPALGPTKRDTLGCIFRAYLCLFLKSIMIQRYAVLRADIYEEEDFSPLASDVPMGDSITDETLLQWLDAADKRLDALLRQSSKGKKKASVDPLHATPAIATDLATLLHARLQYRRQMYLGWTSLGSAEAPDLEAAAKAFEQTLVVLDGIATEQLEASAACFQGSYLGFDNHMSRLLASTMPPRETKLEPVAACWVQTTQLCRHLVLACSPTHEFVGMDDLKSFLAHLSALHPNIVVRSYVVLFLYIDKKMYGRYNFMDWLADSMILTGVPSVLLSTQEGIQYSTRCIEAVYESLKCHLHNRPRQRHRLELLLDEWVLLQVDAASIDDKFVTEMGIPKATYPRYFTSWALEQTSALMIQYLTLGFELDLYTPTEYTTIYWYLDFLLGSRIHNLTNAWSFVEKLKTLTTSERSSAAAPPPPAPTTTTTTSSKKKKKGKGSHATAASTAVTTMVAAAPPQDEAEYVKDKYTWDIALLETHRSLTRALFQYMVGLHLDGVLPQDDTVYGSAATRFQHRFQSFARLQYPAPLSYDDLVKNCDFSQYEVKVVFQSSDECFKLARTRIDQVLATAAASPDRERFVPELKSLAKVCVVNGVYLHQYSKQESKATALTLDHLSLEQKKQRLHLSFDVHPQYPTIQVKAAP
ncbi:Aste57867_25461 [Aphanomyces stellatus]|uniref:Aste57867_25461 protein n=1 Tax=Aphanomyces stellatus TaxID=120398 RepID=A0A485LXZ4_9STRA|nr:hypothetical protein As57867_025382 [Aphanomyces stellatus]VFU02084.1 Aste57867_25461 [Aphanomyces stellatus]